MVEDAPEDPRKTALKDGLHQLVRRELEFLIEWLRNGKPVLLDRDEVGNANYSKGVYCPLAIAVGVPGRLRSLRSGHTDEEVSKFLIRCGLKIYNTRGIAGEFYTDNRYEDLMTAAREVLAEKMIA